MCRGVEAEKEGERAVVSTVAKEGNAAANGKVVPLFLRDVPVNIALNLPQSLVELIEELACVNDCMGAHDCFNDLAEAALRSLWFDVLSCA